MRPTSSAPSPRRSQPASPRPRSSSPVGLSPARREALERASREAEAAERAAREAEEAAALAAHQAEAADRRRREDSLSRARDLAIHEARMAAEIDATRSAMEDALFDAAEMMPRRKSSAAVPVLVASALAGLALVGGLGYVVLSHNPLEPKPVAVTRPAVPPVLVSAAASNARASAPLAAIGSGVIPQAASPADTLRPAQPAGVAAAAQPASAPAGPAAPIPAPAPAAPAEAAAAEVAPTAKAGKMSKKRGRHAKARKALRGKKAARSRALARGKARKGTGRALATKTAAKPAAKGGSLKSADPLGML